MLLTSRKFFKGVNKLPRPIKEVLNGADGHVYYVIEGEGENIFMGIRFVEYFKDLNNFTGLPGLFFVRTACSVIKLEDGKEIVVHEGDPTVHEGWALYCWDVHKEGTVAGWRKVAEQESVDGPWGIDERILKMLVKKVDFLAHVEESNRKFTNLEERVSTNERNIVAINESITDLQNFKHDHNNKELLDSMTFENGQFRVNGKAIGGNTFLYDNVEDGKLIWKDPTDPESEPSEIEDSSLIAKNLGSTAIGAMAMIIDVVEVDGSISSYKLYNDDLGYNPVLIGVTARRKRCVTFVDTLPDASKVYVNRGYWYPLFGDGVHATKHFYTCEYDSDNDEYYWEKIDRTGEITNIRGARFKFGVTLTDVRAPLKRNLLVWNAPEIQVTALTDQTYVKTVLVRKFGSAPTTPADGTVVFEVAAEHDTGTTKYIDVCPFNSEPAYYQVFSVTDAGSYYSIGEPMVPTLPSWQSIKGLAAAQALDDLLHEGDLIELPEHPELGKILCAVKSVTPTSATVESVKCLGKMKFNEINDWFANVFGGYTFYVKSNDAAVQDGVDYFVYSDATGYVEYPIEVGATFPDGLDVFVLDTEFENGIINSHVLPDGLGDNHERQYKNLATPIDWWTSSGAAACGTQTDADTELGVVVQFEITE